MASLAAQILSKDVVSDIITGPRGTPFMLDASRIFSPVVEERTKPVYVVIEGKRFYGKDAITLVQTLPDIINATQPAGFARAPPPTSDAVSFAAAEQAEQVSANENNVRRRSNLRRSVNQTRNRNRVLREQRIQDERERVERIRKAREERGQRMYATTKSVARGVGTAASYGARATARGLQTAADYSGKGLLASARGVGAAASYGAKGARGLFSRSSNTEARPGSVAADTIVNTNANATNNTPKQSFLSSMFTRKARTPRPGSVAAAPVVIAPPANAKPVNAKPVNAAPINTSIYKAALEKGVPTS